MIRVMQVITRLNIGGAAQHAIMLVTQLNNAGWSPTLVTGQIDAQEGDMGDLAHRHGIQPVVIPTLRNGAGRLADLASLLSLYRLFRRERPTIVHLHLFKARVLGGLAARLAGVPIVLETFHGTLFDGYYRPAVSRLLIGIERVLGRLMGAVVAVSPEVAEELVRRRVTSPQKMRVIPVGLELDRFIRASASDGMLRAAFGWNNGEQIVGLVGRLVPIKGVQHFISAAAQVAEALPGARFVIVGDGQERESLERQSREAGLGDRVVFLGWRRDLEHLYPDFDVVVLSSLNEGTPVSVIEAMAAARPVVATRVGGVPDILQDGVTGVLVHPADPAAIAAAVVRLLGDADERRRLGEAARRGIPPGFTAARVARDVDALYRVMLGTETKTQVATFTDPA